MAVESIQLPKFGARINYPPPNSLGSFQNKYFKPQSNSYLKNLQTSKSLTIAKNSYGWRATSPVNWDR